MIIIKHIKQGFRILKNPEKCFEESGKYTLEHTVAYYTWMLISVSIIAGLFNFIYSGLKAVYFDTFFKVDINYSRLLNYSLQISTSIIVFYIFLGTFVLFIISAIIKLFLPKIKYTNLLKLLLYSTTPLLLFSWIPYFNIPLIIWAVFLFATGLKSYRGFHVKKDSIEYRE